MIDITNSNASEFPFYSYHMHVRQVTTASSNTKITIVFLNICPYQDIFLFSFEKTFSIIFDNTRTHVTQILSYIYHTCHTRYCIILRSPLVVF